MAIGGALNLEDHRIFQEFVKRAGGAKAKIVVLPQASSLSETGPGYSDVFKKLGAKKSNVLEFRERSKADQKRNLESLSDATGIFSSCGTHMRLTSLLGGTEFEGQFLAA